MHLKKPFILGITGGMGVGKSTVTSFLFRLGAVVSDADQIVHYLYETKDLQTQLKTLFPLEQGPLTRNKVSQLVVFEPSTLKTLEQILHPLVLKTHLAIIQEARVQHKPLVVLDIPLLYETGWDSLCDGIILVICDPSLQRQRLLRRPHMTLEKIDFLLSRQWTEEDKRRRSPWIIDTSKEKRATFRQLRSLINHHCPLKES